MERKSDFRGCKMRTHMKKKEKKQGKKKKIHFKKTRKCCVIVVLEKVQETIYMHCHDAMTLIKYY